MLKSLQIGRVEAQTLAAPMNSLSFYNASELTLAQLHSLERLVLGDFAFLNARKLKLLSGREWCG